MTDTRHVVLEVGHGDADAKKTVATVCFCESSASLTVDKMTVHIPWRELAQWQAWLADRIEDEQ
jgi:hypothetical protein